MNFHENSAMVAACRTVSKYAKQKAKNNDFLMNCFCTVLRFSRGGSGSKAIRRNTDFMPSQIFNILFFKKWASYSPAFGMIGTIIGIIQMLNNISDLSNLISELTNYTVVASKPHDRKSVIKNIQLITIDPNTILLVTVINKSQVKNNVLKVNESVSQEVLSAIAELLNSELDNLTLSDITLDLIASIKNQLGKYKNILDPILDVITDMINEVDTPDYYASGITNILNFPEFTDVTVARELIGLVENKNMLNNLLTNQAEEVYETVIEDENGILPRKKDEREVRSVLSVHCTA